MRYRFAKWACDRFTAGADLKKKNHLFRWSSFCCSRICKQAKLLHLEHRKPERTHWKANAPKSSHCLVSILDQRHNWVIVFGPCWTNFCLQKLKRRILVAYSSSRTALPASQPKLHLMFCAMFFNIAITAAELRLFSHLGTAIWHRWTIICEVLSKISVTPISQAQLTL